MGKLIKTHWSRLILLTAALYQVAAGIHGYFWPKIFWDVLTTNLNPVVKPIPILQTINVVFGLIGLAWEWPLPLVTRYLPGVHRSVEARLVYYPLAALAALLLYQGTNAGIYYLIGSAVLFWGFAEGEGIAPIPWTLPRRPEMKGRV